MTFAAHTNDRRHIGFDPIILGQFREADNGNTFEFGCRWSAPSDEFCASDWLGMDDFPHVIYTTGGRRYANVKKTVAYIVIDEDDCGNPVVEKWSLRGHKEYKPC